MRCPYCQHENPDGTRFCAKCHAPQPTTRQPAAGPSAQPGPAVRFPARSPSPPGPPPGAAAAAALLSEQRRDRNPFAYLLSKETPSYVKILALGPMAIGVLAGAIFMLWTVWLGFQSTRCKQGAPEACQDVCNAREPSACTSPEVAGCDQARNGCNALGWAYVRGTGTPPDPVAAAHAFERACQFGLLRGCDSLGYMHLNGQGVPPSEKRAIRLFHQACAEDLVACLNQGLVLHFGRGVQQNQQAARGLFKKGCDRRRDWQQHCDENRPEECATGMLVLAIGACGDRDLPRAQSMAKTACPDGYGWACQRLQEVAANPELVVSASK